MEGRQKKGLSSPQKDLNYMFICRKELSASECVLHFIFLLLKQKETSCFFLKRLRWSV